MEWRGILTERGEMEEAWSGRATETSMMLSDEWKQCCQ